MKIAKVCLNLINEEYLEYTFGNFWKLIHNIEKSVLQSNISIYCANVWFSLASLHKFVTWNVKFSRVKLVRMTKVKYDYCCNSIHYNTILLPETKTRSLITRINFARSTFLTYSTTPWYLHCGEDLYYTFRACIIVRMSNGACFNYFIAVSKILTRKFFENQTFSNVLTSFFFYSYF